MSREGFDDVIGNKHITGMLNEKRGGKKQNQSNEQSDMFNMASVKREFMPREKNET